MRTQTIGQANYCTCYRFCARKTNLSTVSGFKDALWKVTMFPLQLKLLSEGELTAGTQRYFLARRLSAGYETSCFTHSSSRALRSLDQRLLVVPRTRFKTRGDRAFQTVAPRLWNSLPLSLRCTDSIDSFKKQLKTFLFRKAFD